MNMLLDKADGLTSIAPFPYAVIPEALPWGLFDRLRETFPEREILSNPPYAENQRVDLHAKDALKLPRLWQEFVMAHVGPEFWQDIVRLFGDAIRLVYPDLELHLGELDKLDTCVRGVSKATVNMECQPGVNTPLTEAGRVRGPHLDNPVELVAGLLYMEEGEGDLQICKLKKKPTFYGKLEIHDDCVEVVTSVKYRPNTLVTFLNMPTAVHAVSPRQPTGECRRLVNFAAELNFPLFRVGHGKY